MALRWPLPALLTWLLAWALALGLRSAQAPLWATLGLPMALGALVTWLPGVAHTPWRRLFVAGGFPLSLLALGQGGAVAPGWWLLPLALLLLAYPVHAWRDAPVFPTPAGALQALARCAPLHPAAGRPPQVLDAGCGLGDGLIALREAYPHAALHGVEWSRLWRWVARWRCPWAQVRQGDMWAHNWAPYDLVYVFQRPESMARAWAKAQHEMRPGSWLVSLEFAVCGPDGQPLAPHAQPGLPGGRPIWVYQVGAASPCARIHS